MLLIDKLELNSSLPKENIIQLLLAEAIKVSHRVFIYRFDNNKLKNYEYDKSIASQELGLDEELIGELINDYISQIFHTRSQFDELIKGIKKLEGLDKESKKIDLKKLAHKNLGVARNLRINDAEIFLDDLMHKDDIEHLEACVDALETCAFKLNPKYALNVLQVMKMKCSF